jgi:hypothetical protein
MLYKPTKTKKRASFVSIKAGKIYPVDSPHKTVALQLDAQAAIVLAKNLLAAVAAGHAAIGLLFGAPRAAFGGPAVTAGLSLTIAGHTRATL